MFLFVFLIHPLVLGFSVISMDWEKAMGGGWELKPGSPERMGNLHFVEKKAGGTAGI